MYDIRSTICIHMYIHMYEYTIGKLFYIPSRTAAYNLNNSQRQTFVQITIFNDQGDHNATHKHDQRIFEI